jgi:hypothetical protein
MRTHWRELGEVWLDDMYVRFSEALEEVTLGIDSYLDGGPPARGWGTSAQGNRLRLVQDAALAR